MFVCRHLKPASLTIASSWFWWTALLLWPEASSAVTRSWTDSKCLVSSQQRPLCISGVRACLTAMCNDASNQPNVSFPLFSPFPSKVLAAHTFLMLILLVHPISWHQDVYQLRRKARLTICKSSCKLTAGNEAQVVVVCFQTAYHQDRSVTVKSKRCCMPRHAC